MLAAVILSGGESSRMGSPKALVPLGAGGQTFLEHLLEITRQPEIGWTRIVLGKHTEETTRALALDPACIVVNPDWKLGQISSIQAAIRSLPAGETQGVMLFLVDHPLISSALVAQLVAEFQASGRPIVLPTFHGKRGHPVIFAERLYGELLAASPDQGAREVVWAHADEVREVPTDEEGIVLNLNSPEALRQALNRG
jgi:molybdenum cofactor cytidylyltransferase